MLAALKMQEANAHLIAANASTQLFSVAYKLAGRTEFRGLSISIETKKGQIRKGVGADGKPWKIKMPFDYGYIRGTVGADGAHIDCFIGPNEEAEHVYVIHQHKENSDTYDEDKVMLGFDSQEDARKAYDSAYNIDIFLGMHEFNFEDFCNEIEKKHGKALECGGPGSGRKPGVYTVYHGGNFTLKNAIKGKILFTTPRKALAIFYKNELGGKLTAYEHITKNPADEKDVRSAAKVVGFPYPKEFPTAPDILFQGLYGDDKTQKLVVYLQKQGFDSAILPSEDMNGDKSLTHIIFDTSKLKQVKASIEAGGPGSGEYVHKKGFHLASTDRSKWDAHLNGLKIPPGAKSVEFNPDKQTKKLIVVWYDQKDRDHPIYHQDFQNSQAEIKFTRVQAMLKEKAKIEKQLAAKQASEDPKEKEHADVAQLINKTGIRPGSETDTGAKVKAYGATTLEGRHVVTDDKGNTSLQFVGKEGKSLNIPVEHAATAKMLQDRKAQAGDSGQLFPNVSQKSLGEFTHTLDGGNFKTKDMRTALGTSTAQQLVEKMPMPKDEKEYKSAVKEIAIQVSTKLGNTPAMALKAYIAPQCFSKWRAAIGI